MAIALISALVAGLVGTGLTRPGSDTSVRTEGLTNPNVSRQLRSPTDPPPETFAYVDPVGRSFAEPEDSEPPQVEPARSAEPVDRAVATPSVETSTTSPTSTAAPQISEAAATSRPGQAVLPASVTPLRSPDDTNPPPPTTTQPATTSSTVATTTTSLPAAPPSTTSAPTTAAPTTTTVATTAPPSSTTTAAAPSRSLGPTNGSGYIAPTAGTYIPVYDTAWQMLVRSTPQQADQYFASLKSNGFSGAWTGVIHHAPATYNNNFAGGGRVGNLTNGNVVLTPEYIAHARSILDAADRHGMKVGLVAAWQNLYLPGGGADAGIPVSNEVRGTITTANAYHYGQQIVSAFGDHPAVSMWVFGGDAGTNNTESNKAVWREMARGVRDAGSQIEITYHTPTAYFGHLNYVGESWLDFIAPETGHAQDPSSTEQQLRTAKEAYGTGVWAGEPRYFNINFSWVKPSYRNPGAEEMRADAQAAENAGVTGYVYGDAGRWTWCQQYGDATPCNANNVAASFGAGEAAVIEVFRSRP